jgi:hypothetical protein
MDKSNTLVGQDATEEREQFIPVRKRDILNALTDHGALREDERRKFRRFCRQLGAVFHYENFDQLEELRNDYYYFNPELEEDSHLDAATLEQHHVKFDETLAKVLKEASFIEVPHYHIEQAHAERHILQVQIETPIDDYREIRFFHRGHHKEAIEVSGWFGLHRRKVEVPVYDDVIVMVMIKRKEEATRRQLKRLARNKLRPGSILLKYFRNIAHSDLNMLFPEVRVVMSAFDKVVLGLPAVAGGIPIIFNLVSTVSVLFLVIGAYLGLSGEVDHDAIKKAFAALSGFAALGGFILRQWLRYQSQSLKYQKEIADNVYFRNVNNNAGVFDYIIGTAEEQEFKETFLAYYFLLTAEGSLAQADLESRIENWLKVTFRIDDEFAVDTALGLLEKLGLLKRDRDKFLVPPLDEAAVVLDRLWGKVLSGSEHGGLAEYGKTPGYLGTAPSAGPETQKQI